MAKHNFRTSVRNGDIIQGDTLPGEGTTYQLTAEELARYGPAAAEVKKGGDNMAIKMSEREAINMRDTADRLAPVTQPAAKAAIINQDFEAAIQEMKKRPKPEPVKTKRCTKCGKDKPTDQYRKGHGACRACEVADSQRRYAAKKAAKAAATMPAIAGDIASAIPAPAAAPQAVKDYAAQHGISLEVTGGGHMIGPSVVAVLGLLDEARRYRVVMSVEEVQRG